MPGWDALGIKQQMPPPFLNPDPYNWWYRVENVAGASINGQKFWVSLANGCQVNSVTPPQFITMSDIPMGPLSHLIPGGKMKMAGLGGKDSFLMGYVIIRVQVDGVMGYNEEQIALVIQDLSRFVAWVPVVLGT